MIFRLTGTAGAVREKSGISKRTEQAYTIREQDVEIAPLVVATVGLRDGDPGYEVGSAVDVAVDISSSTFLRVEPRGDWPKPAGAHVRAAS